MDLPKAVWTSDSVTIKSQCVLKDKLTRSEGEELSGTCSNKNHRQPADNIPRTHRRFSEKYFKLFAIMFFCLILTKLGLE